MRPSSARRTGGPSWPSTRTAPGRTRRSRTAVRRRRPCKDAAFRDALGYAIDKDLLVERVLGGFGVPGNTIIPPVLAKWHVDPTKPRTFDIALAKQKLDAAGYKLDGSGALLDKEGKPISLRLYFPDTDALYAKTAQFVQDWYGQLGIKVTPQAFDSTTLGDLVVAPEGCPEDEPNCKQYRADYDIELWGWSWNVDPNDKLQIFTCAYIGSSSDSQYCNTDYDAKYEAQAAPTITEAERKPIVAEMQNFIYDEAPYDVLFYDANTAAYRTDKFGGWQTQPLGNGTPFFTYSTLQYTMLTDATAAPSPSAAPSAEPGASTAPTPAPSGDGGTTGTGGDSTPPLRRHPGRRGGGRGRRPGSDLPAPLGRGRGRGRVRKRRAA